MLICVRPSTQTAHHSYACVPHHTHDATRRKVEDTSKLCSVTSTYLQPQPLASLRVPASQCLSRMNAPCTPGRSEATTIPTTAQHNDSAQHNTAHKTHIFEPHLPPRSAPWTRSAGPFADHPSVRRLAGWPPWQTHRWGQPCRPQLTRNGMGLPRPTPTHACSGCVCVTSTSP